MILSDVDIAAERESKSLCISPYSPDCLQPASYDVHLSSEFIDFGDTDKHKCLEITLKPMQFMLGSTYETLTIPSHLVARVEGKSSLARLGLMVHITAGFIDPGFSGNITLELLNVSYNANEPICQRQRKHMSITLKNIDHAVNDARIARCYGSSQESVRVFREMNQSGYAALLRRVQVAEARDGYWPPAEQAGPLERLVERVWRFVTRAEVFIVITAMSVLLLGMRMIGGE